MRIKTFLLFIFASITIAPLCLGQELLVERMRLNNHSVYGTVVNAEDYKDQVLFPWMCEKVVILPEDSLSLAVVVEQDELSPFGVSVPAAGRRVTSLANEYHFFQARGLEVRNYIAAEGMYSVATIDGKEISLVELKERVKSEPPIFLMFERQAVSERFRSVVNENVLLITVKVEDMSRRVAK